jgi:hypothetical protein
MKLPSRRTAIKIEREGFRSWCMLRSSRKAENSGDSTISVGAQASEVDARWDRLTAAVEKIPDQLVVLGALALPSSDIAATAIKDLQADSRRNSCRDVERNAARSRIGPGSDS